MLVAEAAGTFTINFNKLNKLPPATAWLDVQVTVVVPEHPQRVPLKLDSV